MSHRFISTKRGNVSLHLLPTTKYYNAYLTVSIVNSGEINEQMYSLLGRLLWTAGGAGLSESAKRERLCQLYGASCTYNIDQKGSNQILSYTIKVLQPSDSEVGSSPSREALKLLSEMIIRPSGLNRFDSERLREEVDGLRYAVNQEAHDPSSLLKSRCLSYIGYESQSADNCKDGEEAPWTIGEHHIYEAYEKAIRLPMHIHIVGNVLPSHYRDDVLSWFTPPSPAVQEQGDAILMPSANNIASGSSISSENRIPSASSTPYAPLSSGKEHSLMIEHGNFNQCKLNITYMTHVPYGSPAYAALFVFHKLFAAGPMSRLNRELRRRNQLVYQVMSELDRFRRLMHINTGTTVGNMSDILSIVDRELEQIAAGKLDAAEITQAIEGVLHFMKVGIDLPEQEIDIHLDQCLTGTTMDTADFLANITAVTADDIVQIALNLEKAVTWVLFPNETLDRSGKGA